jgi:hypothetical protein
MRVCPKCGFEDSLIWHSYRWLFDVDTCRYDEFLREHPLLKELQLGQIIEDSHYFYRRTTKNGLFVRRWEKHLGINYEKSGHSNIERTHPFKNPSQSRLLEVEKHE